MTYRPEVDGLRAIAVLSVIVFHAGFDWLSGGFLGVDIFFVISGYLITTIIRSDIENKTFSLEHFYERRARRILPALFFVMAVSLPMAWLSLTPDELKNYSQSLFAVTTFSSNILFWLESGYFDPATELKPLLHTWSLAVEEQYYIIFPLLMLMLGRATKQSIIIVLCFLMLVSLISANHYSFNYLSASFYLLPFRAWELLMGAICALILGKQSYVVAPFRLNDGLGILGITLIISSLFLFSATTPTPSIYTVVPTAGVALVILFTQPNSLCYKILTINPLVVVGLFSYSAYLWHQPIFAFARNFSLTYPTETDMLFLTLLTLLLAFITWKLVETPFRRSLSVNRVRLIAIIAPCAIFFLAMGISGHLFIKDKHHILVGSDTLFLPKAFPGIVAESRHCSFPDLVEDKPCELPGSNLEDTSVIVLGDSLARVLTEAIQERRQMYSTMVDLSASGCPFLLGLSIYAGKNTSADCSLEYQQLRLDYITQHKASKKVVVLAGNWLVAYLEDSFDNHVGGVSLNQNIVATSDILASENDVKENFFASFERSLLSLSEQADQVVIVTPGYSNGWDPVRRAQRIYRQVDDKEMLFDHLKIPLSPIQDRAKELDTLVNKLKMETSNIKVIDTREITCEENKGVCYAGDENGFFFSDDLHHSLYTNRIVAQRIENIINNP